MIERLSSWLTARAHVLIMSAIFSGGIGAGYLCLPGEADRIAMLERDGHTREAVEILEARFKAGDRRQRTLFDLERFYEGAGEVGRAREMLELMVADRPRDAKILRQLAVFYHNVEDRPAYKKALSNLIELKYSDDACKELVGLERLDGDFRAEQIGLTKCRQKGYRRTEDIVRLAELEAVDGNINQASALLRGVDDLKRLKSERERLALFSILLAADQPRDAVRRAARWAKGGRDEALGLTLVEMLVRANRSEAAIELAREIGNPGDAISLTVGEIMLDRDQRGAAQSYLHGWYDKASLRDERVLVRFLDASLDAEDPALALRACEKVGFDNVPEPELVGIAEAMAAIGEMTSFEAILAHVSPEAIAQDPLLAATVEINRGERQAADLLIAKIEPDTLQDWRLALWARIMESSGRAALAGQTLRRLGVETPIPVATAAADTAPTITAATPASLSPVAPDAPDARSQAAAPTPAAVADPPVTVAAAALAAVAADSPSAAVAQTPSPVAAPAVAPAALPAPVAAVVPHGARAPAPAAHGPAGHRPHATVKTIRTAGASPSASESPVVQRAHAIRRQRARRSRFHSRGRPPAVAVSARATKSAPAAGGGFDAFDPN